MVQTIDCPRCNGGKIQINIPNGFCVITDGAIGKLPLKKICRNCNRKIRYIVVRVEDYDKTLQWLHEN